MEIFLKYSVDWEKVACQYSLCAVHCSVLPLEFSWNYLCGTADKISVS